MPRVLLFPRGRNAIEGLASTDLVERDSDDDPPASKGDAGKHSTTHKTDKEHHGDGKVSAADQQKTDKEHHVGEKVAASDQQNAVAGGHQPQTHITAAEAARGGKVIKSGTDSAGPAKPAGKVMGKGKGGQKSGAKGTGKSKAEQKSDDGKQTGVSLVGL